MKDKVRSAGTMGEHRYIIRGGSMFAYDVQTGRLSRAPRWFGTGNVWKTVDHFFTYSDAFRYLKGEHGIRPMHTIRQASRLRKEC